MLENIRKYSALMAIVLAVFAFGIIFVGNGYQGGSAGSQAIVAVEDTGLTPRQLSKRLSLSPMDMTMQFGSKSLDIGRAAYLLQTISLDGVSDNDQEIGLIMLLVEHEAEKLGIFVSQKDAAEYVEKTLFADQEGNFEQSDYNRFIENIDDRLRLNESDFHKIVATYLTIAKVMEVKSFANIPLEVKKKYRDLQQQTLDADIIKFESESFKGTMEPTEEEIKAFYEEEKDSAAFGAEYFFTPRKVKLTYIPINLKSIPRADENTNEVVIETLRADQERDFNAYRQFLRDEENVGAKPDITALAEKYQLTSITTELSSIDELPQYFANYDLVGDLASKGKIHSYLLSPNIPQSRRLQVDVQGAHKPSYIHYLIEEIAEPQPKTYEESKEDAKMLLIKRMEAEAAEKAAKAAREKLVQAKEEGKDLREVVKSIGGVVMSEPKFSASTTKEGLTHAAELFRMGRDLAPGEVSEVISDDDSSAIILVHKRIIEKTEEQQEQEAAFAGKSYANIMIGFGEWVCHEFEALEVKYTKAN